MTVFVVTDTAGWTTFGGGGGGLTIASGEVLADETTSSVAYTDLATVGPAATVTVGASGVVLVGINMQIGTASSSNMAVALSGANTVAASDVWAVIGNSGTGNAYGRTYVFTGLAAGSTTFTAKYRSPAGVLVDFLRRTVWAIPV